MIDFSTFHLDSYTKILKSIQGYTDNNLRFPKAGELVEKALAECSNDYSNVLIFLALI